MTEKEKVILDVDTGCDDAIAILVANKAEKIDLLGITVVAGNHTLNNTLDNTLDLCSFAGVEAPVYKGLARPLVREQIITDEQPENNLEKLDLADSSKKPADDHAVNFIIESALKYDGDLVLVPTGPLSNIAMAINLEPKIKDKIKKIVLMGGAYGLGNKTPSAEFNIYLDPEAAQVVFASGIPVVMTGLDLTHQAKAYPEIVDKIKSLDNKVSDLTVKLLDFFKESYMKCFKLEAPPVHDVCAVAKVIDSNVFTTKKMRVDVEVNSELTYGRTICDFYGVTGKKPNAEVAIKLNKDRFWELVIDTLARYN